jgi:hypothetical protein
MGIESELPYAEDEWRYIQEHPFVCRNEQSCRYTIHLGHSINQWHMILFHVLVNYFGKRIWNNYLYFIRLKKEREYTCTYIVQYVTTIHPTEMPCCQTVQPICPILHAFAHLSHKISHLRTNISCHKYGQER